MKVSREEERVVVEGRKTVGVRLAGGDEVRGDKIVYVFPESVDPGLIRIRHALLDGVRTVWIRGLLEEMTLEEKAGQLNQLHGGFATGPTTERARALADEVRQGHVGSVLNVVGSTESAPTYAERSIDDKGAIRISTAADNDRVLASGRKITQCRQILNRTHRGNRLPIDPGNRRDNGTGTHGQHHRFACLVGFGDG